MDRITLTQLILDRLIQKAGANLWDNEPVRDAITLTAMQMADQIFGPNEPETPVALPDFLKCTTGTPLTIKNSGGTAAITLASLANGNGTSTGARQAATLDLGEYWAQWWRLETDFELAATPTAGNAIYLFGSFSNSTGAGRGNTSGSDAAYTGYSNNIDASLNQLRLLGIHVCTSQATATVQKALAGVFFPLGRYLNLVVNNKSGAAFHSSDTNQVITLTPLEQAIVDAL